MKDSGTALSATTYEYDIANGGARLVRTCDHPAAGSCASSTRYVDTAYDALARVTSVTNYTGVAGSGTEALRSDIAYDAGSQRTSLTYYEAGTQKDALTFAYDSLGRMTTLSRGGNAVTTYTYNADDTTASRTDHAISTTASAFTYNWRGQELSASSPTYTGSTTFSWRFDGTVASRSWPTGGNAATFAYDRAKRPTTLTEKLSGVDQATLARAYSRAGDITSETQTLTGISGIAGSGTQSFTYDNLHRVTGSSISGGPSQTHAYDANSNRTSWNDGSATTTYDYNETDELTGQHRSGTDRSYAYDAYGNMTSSAVALAGATTYAYDAQDRLLSIAPPSGSALSYTLDALGRHATKSVGGTLAETYGYAGTSEAVVRIDQSSSSVSAAIDAMGNRTATATSTGALGWTVPSLHGDMAAMLSSDGTSVSDAFRYDAYGVVIGQATSALPTPWRFQGRLLLNTEDGGGSNTDLYDFVARAYDPNLAAFTSLDTVSGNAQNPLSLNRFLYANANPTTLIDPDGHMAIIGDSGPCVNYWTCTKANFQRYLAHEASSPNAKKADAASREGPPYQRLMKPGLHYAPKYDSSTPLIEQGFAGGFVRGLYDNTVGFALDAVGFSYRSSIAAVTDRPAFDRQWDDTFAVADYINHHPVESGIAVVGGIVEPLNGAQGAGEIAYGTGRIVGGLLPLAAIGKLKLAARAAPGLEVGEQLTVRFGQNANQLWHAFRHTDELGLSRTAVQDVIESHLPSVAEKIPTGSHLDMVVVVGGRRIQYTAFRLPDGSINVGRIHEVP